MAHIPATKLGEVLLMKKMGIVLPVAPVSSASKRAYDAIFAGLMPSHVTTLDELFPATNNRAGRRVLFPDGRVGSRSQRHNSVGCSDALSLVVTPIM